MAAEPEQLLPAVAASARQACEAESSGICLLEADQVHVRCHAATGCLATLEGSRGLLQYSPCARVIRHRDAQLLSRTGGDFPGLAHFDPPPQEVLMVPIFDGNTPTGALWVATHHPAARPFDREDARQLANLARVATAGLQRASPPRMAIEAAEFAVWDWDLLNDDGRCSPNFHRLLGHAEPHARWPLDSFERHIVEEDVPVFRAALQRALAQGELRFRVRVRRAHAAARWITTLGHVSFGADGRPLRLSGMTIDSSQQRDREPALRDDDAQFRAIFEVTSVGVAQADSANGRVVRVNTRLSHMLGFAEETLIGRPFIELVHRDDRGPSQIGLLQLICGELPTFDIEHRMLREDGRVLWVLTSMNLVRGTEGGSRGLVALFMDITERKHAEEALAASQQQLRMALDASHLALWESDLNGSRMDWSPTLFKLTGVPRQAFDPNADDLNRYVHPDDAHIVEGALKRTESGQSFQIEYRIVRPDGQVRWVAKHGRVIRNRQGLPQRMIGTVADITARKTFEDELRRARDDLESSVHDRTVELAQAIASLRIEVSERSSAEQRVRSLLGRLVGAVEEERHRISRDLHDTLGQDLSVLTLGLQTLSHDAATPPALEQRIAGLLQAAQRMEDEVDRISHELRPLALDELGLEDALRRHAQAWSAESGIALDLHTSGLRHGQLAPMIESTVYRVVQEALTNVRKHAQAQHVSLLAERRPRELRLIVEDDGKGFEPVASSGEGERRSGLGLRGMNERAALVGGQLQIESTPDVGTTIYLTIPLEASLSPSTHRKVSRG